MGLKGRGTKWLNINQLCKANIHLFGELAEVHKIYYFSALATHLLKDDQTKIERHKKYIKCIESTGTIKVMGQFKSKTRKYKISDNLSFNVTTHEEKKTDVAIAVKIFEVLHNRECDKLVIMSGDTDVLPAVETARRLYSNVEILFSFPYKRFNKEIKDKFPNSFKINKQQYLNNQFPQRVELYDSTIIEKPIEW